MTKAPTRILELDGLRGLAIALVLVWHYLIVPVDPSSSAFRAIVFQLGRWTWSGVDLFFVLSGFLITRILLTHSESKNYYTTFYIRRCCRIFPLYYTFLASFAVLTIIPIANPAWLNYFIGDHCPLFTFATFTHNICMAQNGGFRSNWIAIYWSLAIEEQFYLLLPLTIRVLSRRLVPVFFIGLLLSGVVLRSVSSPFASMVLFPWHCDSLAVGGLIAYFHTMHPQALNTLCSRVNMLAVFLVLTILLAINPALLLTVESSWPGVYTWYAFLYGSLLVVLLNGHSRPLTRLLRLQGLRLLGERSYAIYVMHQAVNGMIHFAVFEREPRLDSIAALSATACSLVATMLLAEISWRVIERRAISFGHSYQYESGHR
ncbi:MAG: acyltransferase [Bdellovibrionales bacterium]|nr:acyltransferase [Bdellovibrionales bacterium]